MKCQYKYCKHDNFVEKENAVKVGNTYYCKDCYEEKMDKKNITSIIKEILPNEVMMNINKCISDWIHKKGFDTKYVIYTLEYIKRTRSNLKSVYGVIYYLNNANIRNEYESKVTMDKYNKVTKNKFETDETETKFTYNSNTGEGWCKIL